MRLRRVVPIVAVAIVAVALAVKISSDRQDGGATQIGFGYFPEAHPGEPFAKELFDEVTTQPFKPDDDLFFVNGDMDEKYVHVDGGIRRSLAGASGAPVIWFVGGSTMFGYGQRDEHTIPSEVVRLAKAAGTPVQVVNLGVSAYLAWQETGLLERWLDRAEAPDLIVVYHGVNDLSHLCRQLAVGKPPGGHENPSALAAPKGDPKIDCYADPEKTGGLLAGIVDQEMDTARKAAGDVPILEYWQPYAATRKPNPFDKALFEHVDSKRKNAEFQAAVYRAALEQRRSPTIDLTDAHDSATVPIYYDYAHTNEKGAQMVAEAMWHRSLQDQVKAVSGTS